MVNNIMEKVVAKLREALPMRLLLQSKALKIISLIQ